MSDFFENLDMQMQAEADEKNPRSAVLASQMEAEKRFSNFVDENPDRVSIIEAELKEISDKYASKYEVNPKMVYAATVSYLTKEAEDIVFDDEEDYSILAGIQEILDVMADSGYGDLARNWYQYLLDKTHDEQVDLYQDIVNSYIEEVQSAPPDNMWEAEPNQYESWDKTASEHKDLSDDQLLDAIKSELKNNRRSEKPNTSKMESLQQELWDRQGMGDKWKSMTGKGKEEGEGEKKTAAMDMPAAYRSKGGDHLYCPHCAQEIMNEEGGDQLAWEDNWNPVSGSELRNMTEHVGHSGKCDQCGMNLSGQEKNSFFFFEDGENSNQDQNDYELEQRLVDIANETGYGKLVEIWERPSEMSRPELIAHAARQLWQVLKGDRRPEVRDAYNRYQDELANLILITKAKNFSGQEKNSFFFFEDGENSNQDHNQNQIDRELEERLVEIARETGHEKLIERWEGISPTEMSWPELVAHAARQLWEVLKGDRRPEVRDAYNRYKDELVDLMTRANTQAYNANPDRLSKRQAAVAEFYKLEQQFIEKEAAAIYGGLFDNLKDKLKIHDQEHPNLFGGGLKYQIPNKKFNEETGEWEIPEGTWHDYLMRSNMYGYPLYKGIEDEEEGNPSEPDRIQDGLPMDDEQPTAEIPTNQKNDRANWTVGLPADQQNMINRWNALPKGRSNPYGHDNPNVGPESDKFELQTLRNQRQRNTMEDANTIMRGRGNNAAPGGAGATPNVPPRKSSFTPIEEQLIDAYMNKGLSEKYASIIVESAGEMAQIQQSNPGLPVEDSECETTDINKEIGGKEGDKYQNWDVEKKQKELGLEHQDFTDFGEPTREFLQPGGEAPYSENTKKRIDDAKQVKMDGKGVTQKDNTPK